MSSAELEHRRLSAELALLELYDVYRPAYGHDYGCGQRARELRRYRSELETIERAHGIDARIPEHAELAEAWSSVAAPKVRRLELETYRRDTPATRRTLKTWRIVASRIGVELERGSDNG